MAQITRHFFVCQNERPAGGRSSCTNRGGAEILSGLQLGLASHPELWSDVAVTPTGCLGPCLRGPTIVVYPEGVWYTSVTRADISELVESHLVHGVPVERLRDPILGK